MKIKLKSEFKSLKTLDDVELPNFVILTGVNGAGKTHLLQAIHHKAAVVELNGIPAKNIRLFFGGLGEIRNNTFYSHNLERFCIELRDKLLTYLHGEKSVKERTSFETFFTQEEQEILNRVKQFRGMFGKHSLDNVSHKEIMRNTSPDLVVKESHLRCESIDVFQPDLAQIFKRYQILHARNDYNCYLKDKKGRTNIDALSDTDFRAKYGEPPWVLVNEILTAANMGYSLTTPEGQEDDESFTTKLISQSNGFEIDLSDLSSGEKVLMSMAVVLFNSRYEKSYPDVLLLDEPDCHLHPSIVGKLLEVIEKAIVRDRNVCVVMTTHSPSTVALAPEECLYAMEKVGGRISKQTKDRCIKILTSGVPTLSIDYDNRIQVFVESKHDAKNYSDIYEALKDRAGNEVSLNFISSGAGGSGSSDQVREIVTLLRRNGNTKIYGVIDWDKKNTSNDFVKVIACEKRYSLENLIFDPLLLAVYLIRESHLDPQQVGFDSDITYVKLGDLQSPGYEKLALYVTDKIAEIYDSRDEEDAVEVSYVGGHAIPIPRWYLQMNGHDLEGTIKQAFPRLNRFRSENDLKSEIIKKVATDFPQLMPFDFVELFNSIQSQHIT